MKNKKYDIINQVKTWNSQQSDVDLFSKMQGNFLEKFFRYNLSDYFNQTLLNLYEDILEKKLYSKSSKSLASHLFLEFQQKVQNFYKSRSKSVQTGQLPHAFRYKHCNLNPTLNIIKQKQLIFIDVKIKAEVAKIEQIPTIIINQLQSYKYSDGNSKFEDGKLDRILTNYKQEYFNVFVCYFGDFNFHIFKKDKYDIKKVRILGKTHNLRIFVFYISRQGMVETFKTINKISNLQYINDLVIQFYQMKRQKNRNKRVKNDIQTIEEKKGNIQAIVYKAFGAIGLVAAGYFIMKLVI